MDQLSIIGQLSNLPDCGITQPIHRKPLGQSPHLVQYLQARVIETRRRYIATLQNGPLNQKQISAILGVINVRKTLRILEKEGYLCDAAPGQKRKKQLKLWKWTGKTVE